MIDPRHVTELSTYLRALADQAHHNDCGCGTGYQIADRLRELADRTLVALPHINPQHDQLHHWTELSDHRLNSEIQADAWNLAAGICVVRDRALIRDAGRDAS